MPRRLPRDFAAAALAACLVLPAGGCQFRPNPLHLSDDGPELGPAAVTADDDLASAPPDDLGAVPLAGDLQAPAVDLVSPCTRVDEPFARDAASTWTLMGDASIDAAGAGLQLTSLGFNVAGSAFYDVPLPAASFDARFQFRIADGSGADGLAFVVASAASANALTPFGNGILNAGYGLGYLGMDGFAVELDTFMNVGNGDPNANHVSLVRTSDGAHRLNGTPGTLALRSTSPRSAHIRLAGGHLTVDIDGTRAIDADLPADFALPAGAAFFGFTAAASALDDRHAVSDLHLTVGPAALCL